MGFHWTNFRNAPSMLYVNNIQAKSNFRFNLRDKKPRQISTQKKNYSNKLLTSIQSHPQRLIFTEQKL